MAGKSKSEGKITHRKSPAVVGAKPLKPDLEAVRARIDAVDEEIHRCLNERARLAQQVGMSKAAGGRAVDFYRPEREAQVLRAARKRNAGPLRDAEVLRLFREIMSACLAQQEPLKVAFLGPEGTFTQTAVLNHFGHSVRALPLASIDEVFHEVEAANADFGVVPIENSTEGTVNHTLDRFLSSPLKICGEVELRIRQHLMGTMNGLSRIARVCSRWLPRRIHGSYLGLAITAGALGGALAQPLTASLLRTMGWRNIFVAYAFVGVVWASVWYLWFRDDPHHHRSVNDAELALIGSSPPAAPEPVPWRAMFRNRSLLALGGMCFGALYGWYFYLNWIPKYLLQARGFDIKATGWLAALPLLSIALGVWLGGLWSDLATRRFGPRAGRRLPGLVGFPLASGFIVCAVTARSGLPAALFLSLAGGLAAMGVAPAWATVVELAGRHTGTVSGMMNTFGNLGGVASPLVIGLCLERWADWNIPLITVACAYLVSAACWLVVDPEQHLASAGS
jgi:chorismate mutase-like protein